MSERQVLVALAAPEAILAPRDAAARQFGVFRDGDRRRRPRLSIPAAMVKGLVREGALGPAGEANAYRLTPAGHSRLARQGDHAFLAQHAALAPKPTVTETGEEAMVLSLDPAVSVARLARMKTPEGAPWLDAAEIAAARRLALDAEAGARGGLRLSRWAGDHSGGAVGARGSNGAEAALTAGLEARRRVQRALAPLAGPLRAVAQAVCLEGVPLETLERRSAWPARSAKVALKLALSQLAQAYRGL